MFVVVMVYLFRTIASMVTLLPYDSTNDGAIITGRA